MHEIGVVDLRQMYQNSVVLYKNKPVYVQSVDGRGEVAIFDLFTQREAYVPFSLKDFQPLNRRLGFINTRGSVIYAYRLPVRKFKVGISLENIKVSTLNVPYPQDRTRTKERIRELQAPEIADALFNIYPTFKQVVDKVWEREGAIAFDKQFAIDCYGQVFYKTDVVGTVTRTAKSPEDILFHAGKEHLIHLIGNNYVKALRTA